MRREGEPRALARPGRFAQIADNLHVKGGRVGDGAIPRWFIIVKNPFKADRDAAARERHLTRLATELTAINTQVGGRPPRGRW